MIPTHVAQSKQINISNFKLIGQFVESNACVCVCVASNLPNAFAPLVWIQRTRKFCPEFRTACPVVIAGTYLWQPLKLSFALLSHCWTAAYYCGWSNRPYRSVFELYWALRWRWTNLSISNALANYNSTFNQNNRCGHCCWLIIIIIISMESISLPISGPIVVVVICRVDTMICV